MWERAMPAISVEVVYALSDRQLVMSVEAGPGSTLREVIERSGILRMCPEIDLQRVRVGTFGRLRTLEEIIAPGERIEIYRPLPADPKEMRRRRARGRPAL
jgi:putative ubiquitin-RnfH superfamily antitoxin RatB of RatAB toxin-antitoxin module